LFLYGIFGKYEMPRFYRNEDDINRGFHCSAEDINFWNFRHGNPMQKTDPKKVWVVIFFHLAYSS
jgi:hypothetical protein